MVEKKQLKYAEYAMKISAKIGELFDKYGDSDFKIDLEELQEEDNLKHFLNALSNSAPCYVFKKITGDEEMDNLDFNHMANKLLFEFSHMKDEEESVDPEKNEGE